MKGRKQTRLQRQVGMAVEILLGLPGDGENKDKKRSRSAKRRGTSRRKGKRLFTSASTYSTPQKLAIGIGLLQTIIQFRISKL